MAADGEAGFFRFDTNADEVAANIASAMRRIHSSLASGDNFDSGTLATDTARIGTAYDRMSREAQEGVQKVRTAVRALAEGHITSSEFMQRLPELVRTQVHQVPRVLAEEMANIPADTALRQPAAKLGRAMGSGVVDAMVNEFKQSRHLIADQIGNFRISRTGTFGDDIKALGQNPIRYGEETGRLQQLINRSRAEEFIKRDPAPLSEDPTARRSKEEMASGFHDYTEKLRDRYYGEKKIKFDEQTDQFSFTGTNVLQQLRDLERELGKAEATAARLERQANKTAKEIKEMAAAERLLEQNGLGRAHAGRLLGADGEVLKLTSAGVTPEENAVRIRRTLEDKQRYDEEVANRQRLADNFEQTRPLGGNFVGLKTGADAEYYKLNAHGAERVKDEYTIKTLLEREGEALERQARTAQRLNEFNGKRIARQEQNQSGLVGGFVNRFRRGEQTVLTGLGGQIASASAFSLAYGSLFALQNGLRDTLGEFQDYQDSMTDLQVATKDSSFVTDDFVHSLGELARVSGANVGASLDTAARGIRAFGAASDGSKDSVQAIGEATNSAATKLALIADKALPDATGDLIASGSAFGLGPDQLNQVVDAVANAKRNVGGDAGQISQGLALIAGGAQEAGFNLNEAASVIGLVQARTDQSGQAIATRLTRIFQIISGSTGKNLGLELGVDTNRSVKDQIESYADIYSNPATPKSSKDRIASALGGTANLRELLPLLNENKTLQSAYAQALDHSGQGTTEFQRKSENLVGTLKKIQGTISAIQVEFAKSGLFAPLGALVKVLEPALHAIDRLLQAWNAMPEAVRNVLGPMIDVLAVAKAISVVQSHTVAKQGASFAAEMGISASDGIKAQAAGRAAAADLENAGIVKTAEQRAAVEAYFAEQVILAARSRAAAEGSENLIIAGSGAAQAEGAAAGGLLGKVKAKGGIGAGALALGEGLLNPAVIAAAAGAGMLVLFDKYMTGVDQRNRFLKDFSATQQGALGRVDGTDTAGDFTTAARDLRSTAGNIKASASSGLAVAVQKELVTKLKDEAKAMDGLAKSIAEGTSVNARHGNVTAFGAGPIETVNDLATGIDALTRAGQNGITRMRLFKEALESTVKPDDPRLIREQVAGQLAGKMNQALGLAIPNGLSIRAPEERFLGGAKPGAAYGHTTTLDVIRERSKAVANNMLALTGPEITKLNADVLKEATRRGIKPGQPMTDEQIQGLIEFAAGKVDLSDVTKGANEVRQGLIYQMRISLGLDTGDPTTDLLNTLAPGLLPKKAVDPTTLLNGKGKLNDKQLISLLNPNETGTYPGLAGIFSAAEADVPKSDDGRMLEQVRRANLQIARGLKRRYKGPDITAFDTLVDNAEHDYAQAKIDRLSKLSEAERGERGLGKGQIRAIGMKYLRKKVDTAGSDTNLLISIMQGADERSLDIIEASLKRAADLEQAQLNSGPTKLIDGTIRAPKRKANGPDTQRYRAFRRARRQSNVPNKDGTDLSDPDTGSSSASAADKETAGDKAAAAAAAQAARLGGGLAPARAAIIDARNKLDAAKKNSVAHFEALQALFSAQIQMRDAVVAYKNNLDLLHGDMTDPVEQARDALRAARRKFRSDAGMGKDVRAADRVAVRQTQNELEASKFSQRLSDVQTAEQLGKMSHAAYINYLQHEHDRLTAVKHRTRQQTDELNQIDLAMKEAKSQMDGQFNLGDINTNGLVYQVRRQAAEARAYGAGNARVAVPAQTNQTVNIAVNGADVAKVKAILQDYLRVPTAQRRTLTHRRV